MLGMLEVEFDVFSGMPNPTVALSEKEEQELVERILSEPAQMSPLSAQEEYFGLGYRGVIVRLIKPDTGAWSTTQVSDDAELPSGLAARPGALPVELRLGSKSVEGAGKAAGESAADWLLEISKRKRLEIHDEVWEALHGGVQVLTVTDEGPPEGALELDGAAGTDVAPRGATWWACPSAVYLANADLFNQPQYIGLNNCYCFASNHLANSRYALPGRRGGRPACPPPPQCSNVIDGLRADGWVDGCQSNALTIALVIWPNVDYHFYRVVTPGPDWWWGHKPGATAARYTDDSGRALKQPLSPANCNRGNYIHFCGYFYQNNSTAFVA
jgi:hypothetical protein